MMDTSDTQPDLEAYLKRWSWAAFLGNWIWGLGHGLPFALVCLLPGFNVVGPVVLGIYGNRLAWNRRKWESFEAFRTAQDRWTRNSLIFFAAVALLAAGFLIKKYLEVS